MTWTDNHTTVLRYAAMDDTAAMTAERTGISLHMVRAYRHEALRMLGVHSIHGAVSEAIRQGVLIFTDDGLNAGMGSEAVDFLLSTSEARIGTATS